MRRGCGRRGRRRRFGRHCCGHRGTAPKRSRPRRRCFDILPDGRRPGVRHADRGLGEVAEPDGFGAVCDPWSRQRFRRSPKEELHGHHERQCDKHYEDHLARQGRLPERRHPGPEKWVARSQRQVPERAARRAGLCEGVRKSGLEWGLWMILEEGGRCGWTGGDLVGRSFNFAVRRRDCERPHARPRPRGTGALPTPSAAFVGSRGVDSRC